MTADSSVYDYQSAARVRAYDLHVHTTHSDGRCSPSEVVRAAHAVGLAGLAITDHDCVSALTVARLEAIRVGIELIAGIELTAADPSGREYHLLGYYLREDDAALTSRLEQSRAHRLDRTVQIAALLRQLGYRVDLDALVRSCPRSQPGRRHFAQWLVQTGQLSSPRMAFAGMMEQGGPAFVPKRCSSLEQAIKLIREAGGVVALAHPPRDFSFSKLALLREQGLEAVEFKWPGLPASRSNRLKKWADELDLVPIAGSDFHEPGPPQSRWVGLMTTPAESVARLQSRCWQHDLGRESNSEPLLPPL